MTRAALFSVFVAGQPAQASPVLETYGSWGNTTPFEARVVPGGTDATYFNPALLVDTPPGPQVAAVLISERLQIDLAERSPGLDVAESVFDARAVNPDGSTRRLNHRPLPTSALINDRGSSDDSNTRAYLTLGMNVHVIPDRLAVGVHALLPLRTFQTQRAFFVDEREQYFSNSLHFELYGDRNETNLVSLAAAGRLTDAVSVGVGATLANEGRAENKSFVPDASDQGVVLVNTSVEVRTRLRPYAGLDVRPVPPLHLVATVHFPFFNDTDGSNDLQLWNFEYDPGQRSFVQALDYRSHATPLRAAVGAGWRPDPAQRQGKSCWSAAATVQWTRWSTYRDRHRHLPSEQWFDTFSFSAGGALLLPKHRVGLDATFSPSPVPDQTGRTNYIDNNRVGAALGYATRWEMAGGAFEAGVQLQVHRLLPREVAKSADAKNPVVDEFPDSVDARTGEPIAESAGLQTNNPGYPAYSSEGWLLGGGVTLSSSF